MNSKAREIVLPAFIWIASLYFIEGLPYTLVNNVSIAVFKTLQVSNSQIGFFVSLLYFPWAIKFLWSPFVNFIGSLRGWIIVMQIILAILVFFLAVIFLFVPSFTVLCVIFACMSICSATYDIACDGYYLNHLNVKEQALYVGWRNTAYKIAWIFGSGALVYIAGKIAENSNLISGVAGLVKALPPINSGWCVSFFIAGVAMSLSAIFHYLLLPQYDHSLQKLTNDRRSVSAMFLSSFKSFFRQPNMILILTWILIFRAGDAMLLKMAQPFFLDAKIKGGLALSLSQVSFVYGSVGMICLLFGGLMGSWLVYKYGLKKCLLPSAILQSITLLLYWLLAVYRPGLMNVALANAFEQVVYGLATAAYTSYLFTIVKEQFWTSHYAIATGFMAAGIMLPGAVSGYLVDYYGYEKFFLLSFFSSLPGLVCTIKLPFKLKS